MNAKVLIPVCLLLVLAAFLLGRSTGGHAGNSLAGIIATNSQSAPEFWTCSMHPSVKQPEPGKCPICAMDLVPVFTSTQVEPGPREIHLSENAIALADIQTFPVIRSLPTVEVRMVGKVDYDETRLSYITARIPGRLDRLYVDYTGIPVSKGDHLVWLYSPELLAAQEELLQAIQTAQALQRSADTYLRERAELTVRAARDKLVLWGLSPEQVEEIEVGQTPSDHMTINAPVGGIVIHKNALEGMYVEEGTQVYTIADLSHVWVRLDAYESDLEWLLYGQEVEFSTEAYPGERFTGWISFIDPFLDPRTRTVKVRVNVDNTKGWLKPGMFVRAVAKSQVIAGGKVMSPDLAGKWIGPMHPEVVRAEPGPCPVCGMPLVPAESLGYQAASAADAPRPLLIPATAPLVTGKRAVVYVASADQPGVFEGREIHLGPRAGDFYIVEGGLEEGERVVSHGAFKIDSAVQILAKPSMMNPDGTDSAPGRSHGGAVDRPGSARVEEITQNTPPTFRRHLRTVIDAYFPVAEALSQDDLGTAKMTLSALTKALAAVDASPLEGEDHMAWMKQIQGVREGLSAIESAREIESARAGFELVSKGLIAAADTFGLSGDTPVYLYHCPMAMGGEGADWLQNKQGTENPYYGSMMFSCGEERRVMARQGGGENSSPDTRP